MPIRSGLSRWSLCVPWFTPSTYSLRFSYSFHWSVTRPWLMIWCSGTLPSHDARLWGHRRLPRHCLAVKSTAGRSASPSANEGARLAVSLVLLVLLAVADEANRTAPHGQSEVLARTRDAKVGLETCQGPRCFVGWAACCGEHRGRGVAEGPGLLLPEVPKYGANQPLATSRVRKHGQPAVGISLQVLFCIWLI